MTHTEALKLALEALEVASSCIDGYYIPKGKTHLPEVEKAITAIKEALAQPQQEPLEYWNAVEGWVKIDEVRDHMDSVGCGTIYKTAGEDRVPLAIAQPPLNEQETVAVYGYCPKCGAKGVQRERRPNGNDKCVNGHTYPSSKASLAQPPVAKPHEQEPVAYCNNTAIERLRDEPGDWMLIYGKPQHPHTVPLYAFPPPVATQHERPWANTTTWRGLTIEDKKEYVAQDFGGCRFDAMDWAEKRLKEKNT